MDDNQDFKKIQDFLKVVSQVESSGGTNFNHPTIKKGIHAGQSAIGRYGLMPNTVNEVLNRMRLAGSLDEQLSKLRNLPPEKIKETLETNPEMENKIAEHLAQRVLTRFPDEEMAAFSWNQGHNMTPEQIAQKPYKEHDYVKKYKLYKELSAGKSGEKIAMGEDNE